MVGRAEQDSRTALYDSLLAQARTGRISGRDMGSTVKDVKEVLKTPGLLPAGIYYKLGGLYAQQQIAFGLA